jgi:hypothetical protein
LHGWGMLRGRRLVVLARLPLGVLVRLCRREMAGSTMCLQSGQSDTERGTCKRRCVRRVESVGVCKWIRV